MSATPYKAMAVATVTPLHICDTVFLGGVSNVELAS
jgi:hypothetical protein